jgi:hypothetical protein
MGKIKKKYIESSLDSFSKRYENYYNNKTMSDYKIKFEETGEELPAHKIILQSCSDSI